MLATRKKNNINACMCKGKLVSKIQDYSVGGRSDTTQTMNKLDDASRKTGELRSCSLQRDVEETGIY